MTQQATSLKKLGTSLRLRGISKFYGDAAAVHKLDLDIAAGEFVTLLGSSGSGKTTTLMMLAGFTLPSEGSIHIGEKDVTKLPPSKRNLGIVFQNYALFPHLTVAQNLAFPLEMRGMRKSDIAQRVKDGLAQVQLADKAERFPRELSGGQQQRIALARALIFQPQALLMDEPLGALDKNLREHMQLEIKRLHRDSGATLVFVTHDQEEALTMSDRIAVMQNGGIAQISSPTTIYDRPATKWVAQFIGQSNALDGTITQRDGNYFVVTLASGERIRTLSREDMHIGEKVCGILRPEKILVSQSNTFTTGTSVIGTITDLLYLGHLIKLSINMQDGTQLQVQLANEGIHWQIGSTIHISWKPDSVWPVPQELA